VSRKRTRQTSDTATVRPPDDVAELKTPDELPAPTRSGPPPVAERPGMEGFERWLRTTMVVKLLAVIVIAFLFKVFLPFRVSFTLGLVVGLTVLIVAYLIDFYRQAARS
jgi:hypothetical protein